MVACGVVANDFKERYMHDMNSLWTDGAIWFIQR